MKFRNACFVLLFFINFSGLGYSYVIFKLFTQTSEDHIIVDADTKLNTIDGFCIYDNCTNYFIVHGFQADSTSKWMHRMKNALLDVDLHSNVFLVDWSNGSITNTIFQYEQAAKNINVTVRFIYDTLQVFIDKGYLQSQNNLLNAHCIGHSLGAHVCGLTGKLIRTGGLKIRRISGLDPAGPCFEDYQTVNRLSSSDADYVDVIHTSSTLGLAEAIGHTDFYPNDGTRQPGCYLISPRYKTPLTYVVCGKEIDFGIEDPFGNSTEIETKRKNVHHGDQSHTKEGIMVMCSHSRAHTYFTESISDSCDFEAKKCASWKHFNNGWCLNCDINVMGYRSKKTSRNTYYYLQVNKQSPHCGYQMRINKDSSLPTHYCENSSSKKVYSSVILFLMFSRFLWGILN